ncbi:hypothetical protein GWO43_26900 [candidate division KSB1 bacterium]|nr:hypothetical protein [candidate division KSB1 bacterium]NIR70186.1 hypothetical protein [candidate division KSB1 bacterium]NIS27573.1 hypothetical protein [candidate division KSB1 bacterium]NIT74425.1 hypothetical protein [candidate division KSB1 bacterium]NIU28290.1 hypothetical protein [candidate division KSB1 bacterium]
MKAVLTNSVYLFLISLSVLSRSTFGYAQSEEILIERMRQHENSILKTYLEYQKLYYEDKSSTHELQAFENLLTVYIGQVMEIYETLNFSEKKTRTPRDIAARALIFKSLMYLEKAPLNTEYYERACYEYYEALNLYEDKDDPPVIFKDLPQKIQAGDKIYFRLIDIIEDKGQGLFEFGKLVISFRNFRVTANFSPEKIELARIQDETNQAINYTYFLSEERIRDAFEEVFRRSREVKTYVALPQGTYVLRLNHHRRIDYTPLTRFYVRADQEQQHIMEPLANWLILYENPTSKRPDFYKFSRNKEDLDSAPSANNFGLQTNGSHGAKKSDNDNSDNHDVGRTHEKLVAEIVAYYLPQFKIKLMFDLNDPEIKSNAVEIISKAVVEYVESRAFYNEWNHWTASWDIAKEVRGIISPGSVIPIELVELIYRVIKEL